MEPISSGSFTKYLDKLVEKVEGSIAKKLPAKFAIICDGWTFQSVHYFAIFACYFGYKENAAVCPLLAISPLSDEETLDAKSHFEFIVSTLGFYNRDISSILTIISDNES